MPALPCPPLFDDWEIFYDRPSLARVAAILRSIQPQIVLTHSLSDYMEDHQNVARLILSATSGRSIPAMKTLPIAPYTSPQYRALGTRIVKLHPVTIVQNARTSGGGNVNMVPTHACTVDPEETWNAEKVSIWHPGHHDNPFGIRLTALMISKVSWTVPSHVPALPSPQCAVQLPARRCRDGRRQYALTASIPTAEFRPLWNCWQIQNRKFISSEIRPKFPGETNTFEEPFYQQM